MTNHEIWQAVLAEFELKISKANFTTWFANTGISLFAPEGEIAISVPNTFSKSWLERKYHTDIIKLLEKITGQRIKHVDYKVENIKNLPDIECAVINELKKPIYPQPTYAQPETPTPPPPQIFQPTPEVIHLASQFGLNTKYTFNTFIVGKNNELANAAAKAVADRPGVAYNPLFIYGGVGLGKTHLLQAVANHALTVNPNTRILYVSSEKFTNEFIQAVKEGRAKDFKDRYRTVDMLLIDDFQFISGKEQTQEEFFHTFNELHQNNKQIILTSDRPPKAIPALEDRLKSRLEWGMIADIAQPDLETRSAILQTKCQEKNFDLEMEVINLIATSIQSNIRELEGALNKVIAYHQLKNLIPNKESVRSLLEAYEKQNTRKSATPKEIIATVARFYDIPVDDLLSKSREKKISSPRQIIMFLLREDLKLSYPAIGDELGGRDHTTAMHAHTKILLEIENDLKLKQDMDLIKQRLYSM